jgi:hypothetical protein
MWLKILVNWLNLVINNNSNICKNFLHDSKLNQNFKTTPVVLATEREFQASLGYIVRPILKREGKKKKNYFMSDGV